MKDKKGAELTIGTIVIIVLALVVLVVLIVGFTGGWNNLWGRISSYFGGSNIDSVVQACQVACTTQAKSEYCDRIRDVKFEEGSANENGKYNCKYLESKNLGLNPCQIFSSEVDCPINPSSADSN